jgi:hypothetical protein
MPKRGGYAGYGGGGTGDMPLDLGRVGLARPGGHVSPKEAAAPFDGLGDAGAQLAQTGREMLTQQRRETERQAQERERLAEEQRADQARTQIRETFSVLGRDELTFEDGWAARNGEDRFSVADEARKFYEARRSEIDRNFEWNADAREDALRLLADREERGMARALDYVARQRDAQKADSFKLAGMELVNFAAANPNDMPEVLERIRQHADDLAASYPPERAALLARQAQDAALSSALLSASARDPQAALKMLANLAAPQDGPPLLDAATGRGMRDKIETEIRVREAQARAARLEQQRLAEKRAATRAVILEGRIEDARAYAASTGGEPEGLTDLLAEYAGLGEQYAERAARVGRSVSQAREVHAFLREGERRDDGELVPFAEQAARLERLRPQSQDGASEAMERYDLARKGLAERVKEFEADPAAWALREAGRELGEAGAGADGGMRVLERSLAMQRELTGRPGSLLPGAQREALADRWQRADVDGKLELLRSLDALGPRKGMALAEIKAPATAQIAQSVLDADPGAGNDARTILAAITARPEDLPKSDLTPSDISGMLEGSELLRALESVARRQPYNAAYQNFVRRTQDAMGNAVRMAGEDGLAAFDRHLGVLDEEDLAACFFPRQRVDIEALEASLREQRAHVADFLGWQRELLPEADWRERIRVIEERGVWVNAPDGEGFVLLNPATGRAVTGRDGTYFRAALPQGG